MQLQLYPMMTGLPTLHQGRQFLLQLLKNIRFTLRSTESCPLMLPTFGYKLDSRHRSAARLIFSNSQQAIRTVLPAVRNCTAQFSVYRCNVSHSASTHSYTNKQSTMTSQHNKALQSSEQISLHIPALIKCLRF
jgi:hypothetical protein